MLSGHITRLSTSKNIGIKLASKHTTLYQRQNDVACLGIRHVDLVGDNAREAWLCVNILAKSAIKTFRKELL